MWLDGLDLRLELHKHLKRRKKCSRCGLRYDYGVSHCPHCSGLGEHELAELMQHKDQAYKSRRELGIWFIFGSALIIAALVLIVR